MADEHIINVTDSSFEEDVLNSDLPVLLDFWAEWCAPCKALAKVLNEVAEGYQGKLIIAKIDVDKNEQTPQKFGVRGLPTLLLFKGGNIEAKKFGAVSKSQLSAFIDSNI